MLIFIKKKKNYIKINYNNSITIVIFFFFLNNIN